MTNWHYFLPVWPQNQKQNPRTAGKTKKYGVFSSILINTCQPFLFTVCNALQCHGSLEVLCNYTPLHTRDGPFCTCTYVEEGHGAGSAEHATGTLWRQREPLGEVGGFPHRSSSRAAHRPPLPQAFPASFQSGRKAFLLSGNPAEPNHRIGKTVGHVNKTNKNTVSKNCCYN